MNICFVSMPGMKVGGIPSYIYRLAVGVKKIGHDFQFVFLTKGVGTGLINAYTAAGIKDYEYRVIGTPVEAIKYINTFDVAVYEQAGAYNDLGYAKNNKDKLPWYYDAIKDISIPSVAFLHTHLTYTKHCPYMYVWEKVCKAFMTPRSTTADDYMEKYGTTALDIHVIPIPIDCDDMKISNIVTNTIISTSRLDPIKRQHLLIEAIKSGTYQEWKFEMYSGENVWHYRDKIMNMTWDDDRFDLWLHEKNLDLDEIFQGVPLLYSATKYPPETRGGVESAVLEGVIRGAVPILSNEWVEPYPAAFPKDACYSFDAEKGYLSYVIDEIDIHSTDFVGRRILAQDFVRENLADRIVAKGFVEVLGLI